MGGKPDGLPSNSRLARPRASRAASRRSRGPDRLHRQKRAPHVENAASHTAAPTRLLNRARGLDGSASKVS